ncbi:hypothetical protein OG215_35805 [Streptomyces globisporus]|nr:hypothetical protein OG215_35805 [Streptomyces globisporus]
MDCTTLAVPMNYRSPGDGRLDNAVGRREAGSRQASIPRTGWTTT